MKNIIKSKAWDIPYISLKNNRVLYQFSRSLQIANLHDNSIQASRKVSVDHYATLVVVERKEIIVATCANKHQIDILSLNDLTLAQSMKGNVQRGFRREYSVLDEDEMNIYYIWYRDEIQKSIVTKFNLETYEEVIVVEFPKTFLFDIKYVEKKKNCLICGKEFYDEMTKDEVVGEYEIFWLGDFENRIILKNLAKFSYAQANKIGISEKQEILLFYTLNENIVCNLNTNEELVKLTWDSDVSFSENGKYIAYIEWGKTKVDIKIYSIEKQKVIDEYMIEHHGYDLVRQLGFRGDDQYLVFRLHETMYMMEFEK